MAQARLNAPALPDAAVSQAPAAPLTAEQLYRQYSRYVYAVALRILGRDSDVDDVVQDVFLATVRHLSQLRDPDAVRSWLTTTAVRAASSRLRVRRLRSFLGLDRSPDYQSLVDPSASAEDRAYLVRVYTLLEQVPVSDRVAWCLRYLNGASLEDVARHCGCSLATAKRRIAAVNDRLERLLSDE